MSAQGERFELRRVGAWWVCMCRGLRVEVAGDDAAPDPDLAATAGRLAEDWATIAAANEAFVRGLAPSHHVPLQPPLHGGFAAASCGFDESLAYCSLSVTDPAAPAAAQVTFSTGLPDGYATFEVALDDGRPNEISAFAS